MPGCIASPLDQGLWWHGWAKIHSGGLAWLALVTLAGLMLPTIDEVPAVFPGDLLEEPRTILLIVEATFWAAIGLVFGILAVDFHPAVTQAGP